VKLQVLSLAVKLSLCQPSTLGVCQYVAALARYDASYDVRDRARLLRPFLHPRPGSLLARHAAAVFRPDKPKPAIQSSFKGSFDVSFGRRFHSRTFVCVNINTYIPLLSPKG
jgi:hypothetical protein